MSDDKKPKYRKQGNPKNLRPAHDSEAVKARLAGEEKRQLKALFDFVEQYRIRDITEQESFLELLDRQKKQGLRLDALQSEYKRLMALIVIAQEGLLGVQIEVSRDGKRNAKSLEIIAETIRLINDFLNQRHGANLSGFVLPGEKKK